MYTRIHVRHVYILTLRMPACLSARPSVCRSIYLLARLCPIKIKTSPEQFLVLVRAMP